ncbi:MAG: glycosyltransferase family 2 protein [Nitrospirae bacterium]|nr:glycosyltransferase family 2 protein [Nitrospirota bacterium]
MNLQEGFSVLVPAFNEEATIGKFLNDLKQALSNTKEEHEIIVIDDGSKDRTYSIAGGFPGIKVVRHPYNKGYGASVKTGVHEAAHEKIITIDADGQHDPVYIPEMLEMMGEYDLIAGARHGYISGRRGFGNNFFCWLASYLSNIKIPDLTCGLRAFTKDKFCEFSHIFPNKSSLPSTTILSFAISGYNIKFLPIKDQPRGGGVSKVTIIKDGMRFTGLILRMISLFNPLKIFMPISILFVVLGCLWLLRTLASTGGFSPAVAMLFLTGIFIFLIGLLVDQLAEIRMSIGKINNILRKSVRNTD